MEYVGIDLHKKESQICLLTETGEVTERRIRTEPQRFAEVLGGRPRARILIEASTESEWVARCLEALRHEVVVADPNFAPMYGTRTRRVKTDKRDAKALADACVSGTYRKAHRAKEARRQLRAQLSARDALVRQRAKHIVLMGTLVRQQGLRVATGQAENFVTRLKEVELPASLTATLAPLIEVVEFLNKKVAAADEQLETLAATDAELKRVWISP